MLVIARVLLCCARVCVVCVFVLTSLVYFCSHSRFFPFVLSLLYNNILVTTLDIVYYYYYYSPTTFTYYYCGYLVIYCRHCLLLLPLLLSSPSHRCF
ncbi:hypothetical protein BDF19DRAFT_291789 [Syncephalis fuscata]|nr:hypothetical protein BDF19DRAFT_291789 [Syncephalis fuscata]